MRKGITFLAYRHESGHREEDRPIKKLEVASMHPRNRSWNVNLGSREPNKTASLVLDNIFAKTSCKDYKLLCPSGVNALGLPGNWFWQAGLVVRRFYYLEVSPKGSSLERFPTLSKKFKLLAKILKRLMYTSLDYSCAFLILAI